jgi:hypothetical protein
MRRVWGEDGAGGLRAGDGLLKDDRLSIAARGLAVHLLLLPAAAEPSPSALASRPGESRASIEGYFAELERAGYLRRRTVDEGPGRLVQEVTLYAGPRTGAAGDLQEGRVFHWPLPE